MVALVEEERRPIPGVDYPRTLPEFEEWFADEDACRQYLARVRWGAGFRCPSCGSSRDPWETKRGLMHCRQCGHQVSVTAGTVFEGTRKPLRMWFLTMWLVTSEKHGISALGLQRVLGLGSYQTAWAWLHKLRRAMVRPGRELLSGPVEVDETYVGSPEEGVRGRKIEEKTIVVIAAEIRGRGTGRVRLRRVNDVSGASLLPFVGDTVAHKAEVNTDGWSGYKGLAKMGYTHRVLNIKRRQQAAHEAMPRVHRVASLLKRWLAGTHHGGIQDSHLGYYLDEFTFRFNRRTSRARGMLFYRLVQQAVETDPAPYRNLVIARPAANHNM